MKFVPILSKLRRTRLSMAQRSALDTRNELASEKTPLSLDQTGTTQGGEMPSEVTIAAIAAAICAHSGTKPKQIVITTPTGTTQQINLWAAAGRQDIMITRDITGQVGFQY